MEHYDYFVRITRPYSDLSGLVTIWAARARQMVVYEHTGTKTEKIHIHMVIKGSDVCKKQLKNLVEYLNFKGNKDWSFKNYNGNETAIVYMTKGNITPSYVKGYTPEELQAYQDLWTDEQPKITRQQKLYDETFGNKQELQIQIKEFIKRRNASYVLAGTKLHEMDTPAEMEFEYILRVAKQAAFKESGQIWSMKTMNDYKMLVYTYVMRELHVIPTKYREWTKYW